MDFALKIIREVLARKEHANGNDPLFYIHIQRDVGLTLS